MNVGLTVPWRDLNEHMNVIRQDLHLVNSPPIDFGALIQEDKERMGYSALQHPMAMDWNRDPGRRDVCIGAWCETLSDTVLPRLKHDRATGCAKLNSATEWAFKVVVKKVGRSCFTDT